jgi:hypothetical protein
MEDVFEAQCRPANRTRFLRESDGVTLYSPAESIEKLRSKKEHTDVWPESCSENLHCFFWIDRHIVTLPEGGLGSPLYCYLRRPSEKRMFDLPRIHLRCLPALTNGVTEEPYLPGFKTLPKKASLVVQVVLPSSAVGPSIPQCMQLRRISLVAPLSDRRGMNSCLVLRSLLYTALILCFCTPIAGMAESSAPPTSENAYCEKGNVPKFEKKDGPADLPRSCYYTGIDGSPSPGKHIEVAADSDLSKAVESARCGDTIALSAGATYKIRELPAKKCDDQHYITIRTNTSDSKLPAEGSRISPAWAGISNLPGRPLYAQPSDGAAKLMATLLIGRPIQVGDHYRFIGIEWVSDPNVRIGVLVTTEGADHVIFDRNWFHPAEGVELGKGILIVRGTRYIAVINSYLNGFYCIARSGACTDASAIGGGNGEVPIDTLKIYNNFIEASGENILFGGAGSEVNPTDIEIRRNHLFKPLIWKEGEPGYTPVGSGNPPIVKNNFELKSGIRILFEANLLENSWGGFSQTGYSILLTPKNQNNKCPKCAVTDITIRHNRIRNVAGVIQIASGFSSTGGSPTDGGRYSIHDLWADSIHAESWKGQGPFAIVSSRVPLLHDVAFDHVTAFLAGPIFYIGNRFETGNHDEKIPNFSVTNSLFMPGEGRQPAFSSIGGGRANCAFSAQRSGAEAVLESCFINYRFEKNLIIGERGGWPKGTIVVSTPKAAGIRDLQNGVSKDPRLCHSNTPGCGQASPGALAGTDGKDIGADISDIEAAISGIE